MSTSLAPAQSARAYALSAASLAFQHVTEPVAKADILEAAQYILTGNHPQVAETATGETHLDGGDPATV